MGYDVPMDRNIQENKNIKIPKLLTKDDIKIENMAFFENKEITYEDKEEIFNTLQEFYFKQKLEKDKK